MWFSVSLDNLLIILFSVMAKRKKEMSGRKPKKVVKTAGSLLPDDSQALSQSFL